MTVTRTELTGARRGETSAVTSHGRRETNETTASIGPESASSGAPVRTTGAEGCAGAEGAEAVDAAPPGATGRSRARPLLRPLSDTVAPTLRTDVTEARPALPKDATPAGTRAEAGRPVLGNGATARPQAAATDAPAAIEARTAARIGDRCRGGDEGRTVGTGSRKEADGIRKPDGGWGTGGTGGAG